ncbi:hypothetical protein NUW54_g14049 [Trametes sanguinea]|uniref:Uncharacterized protein n=1 Tax=Trametes sanguinea TaxID=158606 RepID=A0ACC1MFT5_9APHY|nr:hypothetical protein NUW54_g14049 [Trametes sanguinea]
MFATMMNARLAVCRLLFATPCTSDGPVSATFLQASRLSSHLSSSTKQINVPIPDPTSLGHRAVQVPEPNHIHARTDVRSASRSPSPAPSLDIRMPTGLGRRASELGEREDVEEQPHNHVRKRSVSLPAAAQAARWREAMAREEAQASSQSADKTPAVSRVPPELLTSIFSFAPRRDIVSLAQVSKSFSEAALRALYGDLDLRDVDDERAAECMASLASRRHVATLVRSFAIRSLPPADDSTSLATVTFAIAFNNMDQLRALTLPRFDIRLLCHTTFSLQRLELHCKIISAQDFHALFKWLARQPR